MKKEYWILILILIFALILRIYTFTQVSQIDKFTWIGGDEETYYELADNIHQGRGPIIDFVFQFWQRNSFEENDALWEPLLPYMMAGLFILFGPSIFLGKLIVFIFSVASILLVFFIGKIVYNESAGLIAAFLLSIHPKHVEYSISIFKDNSSKNFSYSRLIKIICSGLGKVKEHVNFLSRG